MPNWVFLYGTFSRSHASHQARPQGPAKVRTVQACSRGFGQLLALSEQRSLSTARPLSLSRLSRINGSGF